MTFIYDRFWFDHGSRLTGVWLWPWQGDADHDDLVALVSQVYLGDGQDGALEADFLCSHLPWAFGGIHGVGPEGDPWLIAIQVAPAAASELAGRDDSWWPLEDGLERALSHNPEATSGSRHILTRQLLTRAYVGAHVDPEDITGWTMTELITGLLAECAYVPLREIVAGRITGCAFPDVPHECAHDVFRDVLAAWARGQLKDRVPEEAPYELEVTSDTVEDGSADGDEETERWFAESLLDLPATGRVWPRRRLKKWSTHRLKLQAVEEGWSARKARKASRKAAIDYLSRPHPQGHDSIA